VYLFFTIFHPGKSTISEICVYFASKGAVMVALIWEISACDMQLSRVVSHISLYNFFSRGPIFSSIFLTEIFVGLIASCASCDKLFAKEFEQLLPHESACQKVFITDGALWIGLWLLAQYPDAVHILDFFHVCEKLAKVAVWADTADWFEQMKTHLLAGRQLKVRQSILQMKQLPAEQKDDLLTYLENNEYRMKYDEYRNKGLMIGSGPIESAHRTLLQIRMKRSGQRWSDDGCDKMIKLRVALRSQKFDLITNIFRKSAA
jgi:hypothetical protein